LEVVAGEASGSRFDLGVEPVTIGRGTRCQIQILDPKASREHARLLFEQGALTVIDLDSTNGLYRNDESTKQAQLNDGDRLQIGDTVFQVHLTPDAIPTVLDVSRRPPAVQDETPAGPPVCARCGREFMAGEKFCGECGAPRPT